MSFRIELGDVLAKLREMPDNSVHCVVTSPPYWGLRDYGVDGQIGLEATPAEFIAKMVAVFREVRRVLRADGTCWMNMGDSYAGGGNGGGGSFAKDGIRCAEAGTDKNQASRLGRMRTPSLFKPKDLVGMPWRLAFALQEDGWWLRQDIIWSKPNPMPESVADRCTKAHEYVFLLTKSARYFYDAEAIRTPFSLETKSLSFETMDFARRDEYAAPSHKGRLFTKGKTAAIKPSVGHGERADSPIGANKRSVWEIATEPYSEAHFATFPTKLVEPCILAGTSAKGCCARCGAPWVRSTEQVETGKTHKMADGWAVGDYAHGSILEEGRPKGKAGKPVMVAKTVGWKGSCKCDASSIPCTVLDPFNGSGTTGIVALRMGRMYIGIELNPAYREMALARIHNDNPMFNVAFA